VILYNVTINIDDSVHDEWLHWMKTVHIPDVMATGFFIENRVARILAEEEGGKAYSIQYTLKSMNDYDAYQAQHAPRLQNEHTQRYNGKFGAFRTLLHIVHIVQA
jgi:hypothetical protein